jgi:hypothetical protein
MPIEPIPALSDLDETGQRHVEQRFSHTKNGVGLKACETEESAAKQQTTVPAATQRVCGDAAVLKFSRLAADS